MKINFQLGFLLFLLAYLTHQIQVNVTCERCSSSLNCKKITTDAGFTVTTVNSCQMDYKQVYTISKCQQPRILAGCVSNVCYMQQRQCMTGRTAGTCANVITSDYSCGACPSGYQTTCSKSCWTLGGTVGVTCTDACSQISGAQQIQQPCSGGLDSSGNACACCRRSTVFKPAILGSCLEYDPDFQNAQFLTWATQNVGAGSSLYEIIAVLPAFVFVLFLSFSF